MTGQVLLTEPEQLDRDSDLVCRASWPAPGATHSELPRISTVPEFPTSCLAALASPSIPFAPPSIPPSVLMPAMTSAPTSTVMSAVSSAATASPLGRRGMLAAIAGSTVGLAVLISGCADDSVDQAVQKAQSNATLPDAKLTPKQPAPSAALDSKPWRTGGPSTASKAGGQVATAAEPIVDPAVATDAGTTATPGTAGQPAAPAPTGRGTKPATPPAAAPTTPPAPGEPSAPAPQPAPPAPDPVAPVPPAPPAPPPPPPGPTPEQLEAMHKVMLVNRVTYGPTPQITAEVASLGAVAFLEKQLTTAPEIRTDNVLTGTHSLGDDIVARWVKFKDQDNYRPAKELRHAAVIRAARHDGQLAERMVEFWTNHFSTYSGEEDKDVRFAAASDDRDVFRRFALGKFSEMLIANARSVSMQLFLDNYRSTGNRPNQNYAREVMELHTVGVSNGYDEDDVQQVSLLLTGWGLAGRVDGAGTGTASGPLRFEYQPMRHYNGAVNVTIIAPNGTVNTFSAPAGRIGTQGEQDGIDFLNWLARLPNTADYLATKLVRRFVGDDPPASLVASTAAVYLANDTNIVPVLRHILTSREFITNQYPKVRTPFELLVDMVRTTGAVVDPMFDPVNETLPTRTISDQLTRLGHAMWSWPTPDGFADHRDFWISTSTMLRRWELAGRLGNALAPGSTSNPGNSSLPGITVNTTALLPNPLPATMDLLIRAIAVRLGMTIGEKDITAITTFLGVATDAPLAGFNFNPVLGDIVGLLLSHPSTQYR